MTRRRKLTDGRRRFRLHGRGDGAGPRARRRPGCLAECPPKWPGRLSGSSQSRRIRRPRPVSRKAPPSFGSKPLGRHDIEDAVADADFIEEAVPEILALSTRCSPGQRRGPRGRPHRLQHLHDLNRDALRGRGVPGALPGRPLHQPVPLHPGVEMIPHAGTRGPSVPSATSCSPPESTAWSRYVTGFVLDRWSTPSSTRPRGSSNRGSPARRRSTR